MSKKEEEQKEKTKVERFKELWANKRWRAVIKLGMWISFFVLVFLILIVASFISRFIDKPKEYKKIEEPIIEQKVEANISNLLNNLSNSNYTFDYKVIKPDNTYSYSGTKEELGIVGYYESNMGIIKFGVKDNIYYKIENDEYIEDQTIISEEDKNMFNLNNLINIIREYEENNNPTIENDIYNYDFSSEEFSYLVSITKIDKTISKIDIHYNDINYILEYKKIIE